MLLLWGFVSTITALPLPLLTPVLLQDAVTAKRNLQKYSALDTTFSSTREAKFITVLTDAFEAGDMESFTAAVYEYDQVTKLDNWKTAILLKIKRAIPEEPSLT